jgi:hypothetical protein
VQALSVLSALQELNLGDTAVKDVGSLSTLVNLHTLMLFECPELNDVQGLSVLTQVQHETSNRAAAAHVVA